MGYISMNPTKNIKIIGQKVERICAKTISFNDILKFKEIILDKDDITVKYFIMTQVYTGARYQEVAALTWDDVLYDSQQLRINKAYEYAKTRRFKESKSLETNLFYFFPNMRDGLPISNSYVNIFLKETCKEANIERVSTHITHLDMLELII